jgi:hypothetical protein
MTLHTCAPSLSSSFPLFPLSGELPMVGYGALTPAMAALSWRVSHNLIFLRGMIKTDAHDLSLAIPALNFIRSEL